jgi:hypothetical protein
MARKSAERTEESVLLGFLTWNFSHQRVKESLGIEGNALR